MVLVAVGRVKVEGVTGWRDAPSNPMSDDKVILIGVTVPPETVINDPRCPPEVDEMVREGRLLIGEPEDYPFLARALSQDCIMSSRALGEGLYRHEISPPILVAPPPFQASFDVELTEAFWRALGKILPKRDRRKIGRTIRRARRVSR